jgi:hypothetical protein
MHVIVALRETGMNRIGLFSLHSGDPSTPSGTCRQFKRKWLFGMKAISIKLTQNVQM